MGSFTIEVTVEKWVLLGIYSILAMISLGLFIHILYKYLVNKGQMMKYSKPRYLPLVVFLCCITRVVLNAIPEPFYLAHIQTSILLQVFLDLLPEILFFTTYLFLFFIWVETQHLWKAEGTLNQLSVPASPYKFWIFFTPICLAVWLGMLILAISLDLSEQEYSHNDLKWEAVYLAGLYLSLALAFAIYAIRFLSSIRQESITSKKKYVLMSRIRSLLGICIVCSLIHMGYVLLLDIWLRKYASDPGVDQVFSIGWFVYFLFTEHLPSALILAFVAKFWTPKISLVRLKVKQDQMKPFIESASTPTQSEVGQSFTTGSWIKV
eukprot:TRINITY_DN15351_c0_g1_i1.p1 TRINITY_DN15351_c0_g1~~TRINITY_DN15351_c0_g1_i1.p1  ORF type:complete len:322 (+),score=28.22 TRINITY_DN15351_c0_g1_i1:156-1121(+)